MTCKPLPKNTFDFGCISARIWAAAGSGLLQNRAERRRARQRPCSSARSPRHQVSWRRRELGAHTAGDQARAGGRRRPWEDTGRPAGCDPPSPRVGRDGGAPRPHQRGCCSASPRAAERAPLGCGRRVPPCARGWREGARSRGPYPAPLWRRCSGPLLPAPSPAVRGFRTDCLDLSSSPSMRLLIISFDFP